MSWGSLDLSGVPGTLIDRESRCVGDGEGVGQIRLALRHTVGREFIF